MTSGLTASSILRAWECAARRHPIDRALVLLWSADPTLTTAELAGLAIGERDRRLLMLHRVTFGDRLDCLATCPACQTPQEFELSARALLSAAEGNVGQGRPAPVLSEDGHTVRVRSLDSNDLAAAARCTDVESAAATLLDRAVASAETADGPVSPDALPPSLRERIADCLAEWQSEADILLDLRCADCGHTWDAALDIVAFFWAEIEAEAERMLREVAALARLYGWSETEVLALSPLRRQTYLALGSSH